MKQQKKWLLLEKFKCQQKNAGDAKNRAPDLHVVRLKQIGIIMGCHLHELIEAAQEKNILCLDPISVDDFNEIIRVFNNIAPQSVCFDMGDVDEVPEIVPIYELVKEPYQDCWFECNFTHTDGTTIILGMLVIVRDKVQITSFRRKNKKWMIRGVILLDSLSARKNYDVFPAIEIVAKELQEHKLLLSTFLSALNCNNVKKIEQKPEIKLQKSREKRGKKPLFSHWTLELSIPKSTKENSPLNGKHASPRVHLRRGHPRQYASGKFTWVQPCVVGKGKGIVTKDYSAKYETKESKA